MVGKIDPTNFSTAVDHTYIGKIRATDVVNLLEDSKLLET